MVVGDVLQSRTEQMCKVRLVCGGQARQELSEEEEEVVRWQMAMEMMK